MLYTINDLEQSHQTSLMTNIIIPRPIAWTVTQSVDGTTNAAPYSYFMGVSSQPPLVSLSIQQQSDGSPKDTLRNLRDTQRATICFVQQSHASLMQQTASRLQVSEIEHFDISTETIVEGYPPMIADVPAAYCCTIQQEIDTSSANTLVILSVDHVYLADDKQLDELPLIGRIGGQYTDLSGTFR